MLVLSRAKDEAIDIGTDIVVTVLAIARGSVKLGITAPEDIPVHRREVTNRIAAEQRLKRQQQAIDEGRIKGVDS